MAAIRRLPTAKARTAKELQKSKTCSRKVMILHNNKEAKRLDAVAKVNKKQQASKFPAVPCS